MSIPRLSVIIPAYNAEKYIAQAVSSVLNQTYLDQEVIVVDDGSEDNTRSILAGFGERIRVIAQDNRGVSAARNQGAAAARGSWLAFLDADDAWLPDFAIRMLKETENIPANVSVIGCGWRYMTSDGLPEGLDFHPQDSTLSLVQLVLGNPFPVHASLVRRDCFEHVGGFDASRSAVADWNLWLHIARETAMFHCIQEVLVLYRQVPGSMSRNVRLTRDDGLAVLDAIFATPGLGQEVHALREEAYGRIHLWSGANFHTAGQPEEGMHEFISAIEEHPALLRIPDTYYAIICAEQPLAFRGSSERLDLDAGAKRMQVVLETVLEHRPETSLTLYNAAYGQASLALAKLASYQDHRRQSLNYTHQAVKMGALSWPQASRIIVKSLVGARTAARLGRLFCLDSGKDLR